MLGACASPRFAFQLLVWRGARGWLGGSTACLRPWRCEKRLRGEHRGRSGDRFRSTSLRFPPIASEGHQHFFPRSATVAPSAGYAISVPGRGEPCVEAGGKRSLAAPDDVLVDAPFLIVFKAVDARALARPVEAELLGFEWQGFPHEVRAMIGGDVDCPSLAESTERGAECLSQPVAKHRP